jgi:hypothetical protein
MMDDEITTPEMAAFADSVHAELSKFDARLEEIFDKLAMLAPHFARHVDNYFDDRATAIILIFSPLEILGNKSIMQVALEKKCDPLEMILARALEHTP